MDSQVKIVSQCPDTLVLNCYPASGTHLGSKPEKRPLPGALCEELDQLKEQAQNEEEPIPSRFPFKNARLLMMPTGTKGFNWMLTNKWITLSINRNSKMQLWAQVRCSSLYLQTTRDLARVVHAVREFLAWIFGERIMLQPSSLDLAVDVVGFDMGSIEEVKKHFISRAQTTGQMPAVMVDGPDQIRERWGRLTGLPFGARKAPLSALIYDKTHEIKYHSPEKIYMVDIWQRIAERQGFCLLPTATILRIEIRYRREALGQMKQEEVFHGIDDAYKLEDHLPGLWSYAVGHVTGGDDGLPDGWLRYVIPSEDKNRSRWPVHPDWQVIQSAFASKRDDLKPAELAAYARKRKREVNRRRLVAQIAGCVVTTEAWRLPSEDGVERDISDTMQYLYGAIDAYLFEKEQDFTERVYKKRVLYGEALEREREEN